MTREIGSFADTFGEEIKLQVHLGSALTCLCCPACQSEVKMLNDQVICANKDCGLSYPVVDGIPVLINELNSVFAIEDYKMHRYSYTSERKRSRFNKIARRVVPSISINIGTEKNYQTFVKALFELSSKPRVLVLGGRVLGNGMKPLAENKDIELTETDVSFGPRTVLICDAHDIPFASDAFDGVVIQAVLEHVVDPQRCVDEIYRVLKNNGIVYSESPFMQQVHEGAHDYFRFTQQGHRRLFRHFEELYSAPVTGPGMALAWSNLYFLLSFVKSKMARKLIKAFAHFTSWPLKYFDIFLIKRPGAVDAASGTCFMGKKSAKITSDKEIIARYQGGF